MIVMRLQNSLKAEILTVHYKEATPWARGVIVFKDMPIGKIFTTTHSKYEGQYKTRHNRRRMFNGY
jgi:hypothetical protein